MDLSQLRYTDLAELIYKERRLGGVAGILYNTVGGQVEDKFEHWLQEQPKNKVGRTKYAITIFTLFWVSKPSMACSFSWHGGSKM
jgi:hypothetical protein